MTQDKDTSNQITKAILAGIGGYLGWRALGHQRQESVLRLLDSLAEAMAEAERRQQCAQARQQRQREAIVKAFSSPKIIPAPMLPACESSRPNLLTPACSLGSRAESDNTRAATNSDTRWRSAIPTPAVVLIVGKRGSGKSGLAYRLLELFRYSLRPYVVGVPSQARKLLPDWIGITPTLDDLPPKSIAVIDEAYMLYHSRHSMAGDSKFMSQLVNLSRQREQTLIFVSQEARQIDRNIVSSASVIIFKELGILQYEFERKELRKVVQWAQDAFALKRGSKQRWSYVYSPEADFIGMAESELPSFWKTGLSRLYGAGATPAISRPGKKISRQDKAQRAKELRRQGLSYGEIAKPLGVSKSTVVNYLRDYPYNRHS